MFLKMLTLKTNLNSILWKVKLYFVPVFVYRRHLHKHFRIPLLHYKCKSGSNILWLEATYDFVLEQAFNAVYGEAPVNMHGQACWFIVISWCVWEEKCLSALDTWFLSSRRLHTGIVHGFTLPRKHPNNLQIRFFS